MTRSWDECVDLGHGRGRAERSTAEAIWRIDAELGRPADVNEAWRSPEQANANRARWLAYERYLNGGPYAPKAPYALGAEDSVHCNGEAADSDDWYDPAAAAVWRRHGFRQTARYRGTARDEPWHGEHRDEWEEPGARVAGGNATPIPKEWDEMASPEQIAEIAGKAAAEAVVNAMQDTRVTNKLAEVVKNELDARPSDVDTGRYTVIPSKDDGNIYLYNNEVFETEGDRKGKRKRVRVQSPRDVQLLLRSLDNDADDVMFDEESSIVDWYLNQVEAAPKPTS